MSAKGISFEATTSSDMEAADVGHAEMDEIPVCTLESATDNATGATVGKSSSERSETGDLSEVGNAGGILTSNKVDYDESEVVQTQLDVLNEKVLKDLFCDVCLPENKHEALLKPQQRGIEIRLEEYYAVFYDKNSILDDCLRKMGRNICLSFSIEFAVHLRYLLRGINATSVLDQVFQDNLEKDTSLTWQYFGSTIGYMRNYPGVLWNLPVTDDKVLNLFDSRRRSWYSQAVAPPKTILFMVDVSGSQTGLAIGMTRLMVNSTIDSLDGNDFFNILTFNDTTKVVESCYENTLVQATYENKEYMKGRLQAIEPHEESNVCNAFDKAFDALARMRGGAGNNCSETIMLFTDGVEFTCEEVFQARNANKSVRVFTYLLGELVQHAKILQRIACNNHGMYSRIRVRSDVPETVAVILKLIIILIQVPLTFHTKCSDFQVVFRY
ncbi:putative voltage-dependent calcium channel subunit alpha-2/delta-4-like [Apostichopus japonicus]|uniref:Putative voltage-dependent calcium channel subunit alpha-2/delta-4-like n=2 Tax=Stichopus japonicus TaxID=307972 RepID=A0A2G8JVE8_STIJA|nr:putative voltage-dependent calcium channel subunit alpha-2/delta-4-like [Apostichopus japonicus]